MTDKEISEQGKVLRNLKNSGRLNDPGTCKVYADRVEKEVKNLLKQQIRNNNGN